MFNGGGGGGGGCDAGGADDGAEDDVLYGGAVAEMLGKVIGGSCAIVTVVNAVQCV